MLARQFSYANILQDWQRGSATLSKLRISLLEKAALIDSPRQLQKIVDKLNSDADLVRQNGKVTLEQQRKKIQCQHSATDKEIRRIEEIETLYDAFARVHRYYIDVAKSYDS